MIQRIERNTTYEISVKKGEELKLDVLLPNAYKVVYWTKRSTGRKEDWNRSHGVRSDRMTIRDGNLIINNFTATDAGTYEVLDSEGEILIMVTVTGERSSVMFRNIIMKHLNW
uniref:Immunoglobulin subtype domain-containing protein n=1 Tax=Sinocyclocheilus anshuiensis TaxID=1608454 RepID=A0A671QCJ4_9TELE